MKSRTTARLWILLAVLAFSHRALSQALATATGPGSNIAVGGGISAFETDYGHNRIAGGFVYVDVTPEWRFSFESEGRFLRWHANEQVTETDFLGGIRVPLWQTPKSWTPYAKFLAGAGEITLPYGYAHGGFLTYAPGAGLDIALNDRISVRAVDFEYQRWPKFTYGALSPYGLSAGISVRLNGMSRFPKGARARH